MLNIALVTLPQLRTSQNPIKQMPLHFADEETESFVG